MYGAKHGEEIPFGVSFFCVDMGVVALKNKCFVLK